MIEKEATAKPTKTAPRGKKGKNERTTPATIQNTLPVPANDAAEQVEREISDTPVLESDNIVYEQMDYY